MNRTRNASYAKPLLMRLMAIALAAVSGAITAYTQEGFDITTCR